MDDNLNWGIISTGRISAAFARALKHSTHGSLLAVASRTEENADAFAVTHDVPRAYAGYEALLLDPEVDAVYVATPHPMHAQWAIRAAEAGKHVLCEKPLTLNAYEAMAMVEAARRNDVFLMEAFMYRCHPQTEKLVELLRQGVIGEVRMIRASFGFKGGRDLEERHFNNALGGGGILDLGGYAVSMCRLIAAVALEQEVAEPIDVHAAGHMSPESRVDAYTAATLLFPGDVVAEVACSIQVALDNDVRIFGTEGSIVVPAPWFASGPEGGTSSIVVNRRDAELKEILVDTDRWLYAIEADHVAENIERRQGRFPAMTWEDSLGNMRTLDRWRQAIGMEYDAEKPTALKLPVHGRTLVRKANGRMKYSRIAGVEKDISRVVMGGVATQNIRHTSVMYDDYFELGGNCFDTARQYGSSENVVGQWIKNRNIREEIVLITKGAHTPGCYPENVTTELHESLEGLQTDYVDIYFLHRDNPDIPVGEFVDVLNEHRGRRPHQGLRRIQLDHEAPAGGQRVRSSKGNGWFHGVVQQLQPGQDDRGPVGGLSGRLGSGLQAVVGRAAYAVIPVVEPGPGILRRWSGRSWRHLGPGACQVLVQRRQLRAADQGPSDGEREGRSDDQHRAGLRSSPNLSDLPAHRAPVS